MKLTPRPILKKKERWVWLEHGGFSSAHDNPELCKILYIKGNLLQFQKRKIRVLSCWIIPFCTESIRTHSLHFSPSTSLFFESQTSLISTLFSWNVHSRNRWPANMTLLYFSMAQTPCKKEFNFCSLCHPFPLVASFFLHAISWWITTSYPHNLPQYFIKASLNLIATIAFQFLFY